MSFLSIGARRAAAPLAFLIGVLVLWPFMVRDPEMLASLPGRVGPAGWPKFMLVAIAVCALIWLLIELRMTMLHLKEDPVTHGETLADAAPEAAIPVSMDEDVYDKVRASIGIGLIILYGFAIPQIGFPLATLIFIVLWCVIGGVRRPLTVGLVSVLGCIVMLYMFVALARMPLDRGHGAFDSLTVALYQALGIY
jgi:putative tricarboxylic transport membrane protein